MPGTLLDLALLVAAVLFAVSGYRQGFLVGGLSFAGLIGGGVLGAVVAPSLADSQLLSSLPAPLVGLLLVIALATVGQVLAGALGGALRRHLDSTPARRVDALGGSAMSVAGLLLVAWLVGLAVADSPFPSAAAQVRGSVVIGTVDELVPSAGRRAFTSFRELVDSRGFPQVFEQLRETRTRDVRPPDPAVAGRPVVQRATPSVLKVTGPAPGCRRSREGSGFVYAPGRVLTNAHVVAGVTRPAVKVGNRRLAARVVVYDPAADLAVLRVPGLDRPALPFATGPAPPDVDAVVLGYPLDGPFRANPARIIARQQARGSDIYGQQPVQREIYSVKGLVRPGNSGGPLVGTDGRVLGVVFAAAADDASVGYALTADYARAVATAGRTAATPVSTGPCV